MNVKVFFSVSGTLHILLAILLLLPLLWCYYFEINQSLGTIFISTSVVFAVSGIIFRRFGKGAPKVLMPRDAIGIVAYAWVAICITGVIPYWTSDAMPLADAIFESVSGFTTSGSTVLVDIESLPKALLFFRSLTHWIGGLGVVVLFVSIFPSLGVGGKSLFKMEVPGPITETVTPKIKDTSRNLWYTYLGLTFLETMLLYWLGEMPLFDAVNHSFSTMATGGFSIKNASIGSYNSATIEWIIIVFMFLGGANFGLYYILSKGNWRVVLRDTELRFYAVVSLLIALIIAMWLHWGNGYRIDENTLAQLPVSNFSQETLAQLEILKGQKFENVRFFREALEQWEIILSPGQETLLLEATSQNYDIHDAVRSALFQVISLITTTGFASDDYELYPVAGHLLIFFLLLTGGCAGSTSGGIKLFRIVLIGKTFLHEIQMSFRPSLVSKIRIGNTIISADLIRPVMAFMGIYFFFVAVGAAFFGMMGHDMLTALTASMTAVGNFGPGFGTIGPTENFQHFSDVSKCVLALLMLLGRLEFFAILGLFHPKFWLR